MISSFIQHRHGDSGKMVLQALVPFTELLQNAVFTQRTTSAPTTEDAIQLSNEYYQRRMDPRRLNDIQQYIYQSILDEKSNVDIATIFPSSMILAIEGDEDLFSYKDNLCTFQLPRPTYVVDGQHRLMAMKLLFQNLSDTAKEKSEETNYVLEYLTRYSFPCTILVNYDLWEQGQVFANVNFKQKPVNRSLYFEIYGSEYREDIHDWNRNNIYLAHNLVRFMNTHPQSPFRGHIKMLGTGKGYISQAFLVEALMRHFRSNGLWWYDADSKEFNSHSYEYMATELLTYYSVIASLFAPYWPREDQEKGTLICRTTGTGAFIHLLSDMREKEDKAMLSALVSTPLGSTCFLYRKQIESRLHPIAKIAERLFGKESKYGGTGGKGLENALYKEMRSILVNSKLIAEEMPDSPLRSTKHEPSLHTVITSKLHALGITHLEEDLDVYFASHPIDDIDTLGNHYEHNYINNIYFTSYKKDDQQCQISGNCSISFTTYLDHEEEVSSSLTMPCTFNVLLKKYGAAWKIDDNGTTIKVDTSSY